MTEANVVMTSGQTTTLNKALAPSGVLAGRVTDAVSGAPIADVAVYVKTTAGASVTNTTTNGDGSYSVPVAAGTYNVRYNLDWQLTEWQGVTEANVVLTSGQTTTLNEALQPNTVTPGTFTLTGTSLTLSPARRWPMSWSTSGERMGAVTAAPSRMATACTGWTSSPTSTTCASPRSSTRPPTGTT